MTPHKNIVVGIDLSAKPSNPTGWAMLDGLSVSAKHLFSDEEIAFKTAQCSSKLTAIDAPLSLPQNMREYMRRADKEMHRKGYAVLPPRFKSMKKLSLRAANLVLQLQSQGLAVIEVHPLSSRKALGMPRREWGKIQKILLRVGLKSDLEKRALTSHEIDAVTAALTAALHLKRKTELIGDPKEGCITIPRKRDWRALKL